MVDRMKRLLIYLVHYGLSFIPGYRNRFVIRAIEKGAASLVILGNGPALNNYRQSLTVPEENVDYMCVNFFGKHESFLFFRPRHYVVFDPLLFQDLDDETSIGACLLSEVDSRVKWNMRFYIPLRFWGLRKKISKLLSSSNIEVIYFRDAGFLVKENKVSLWMMKHQIISPKAQNVLIACIYLAILLNYHKVFLEGADHSWHKYLSLNKENKLMIKDVHFYDGNPKETPFLKDPKNRVHFTMSEIFYVFYRVHKGYVALRCLADRYGIKVINRTPDSFIDAFERQERYL